MKLSNPLVLEQSAVHYNGADRAGNSNYESEMKRQNTLEVVLKLEAAVRFTV